MTDPISDMLNRIRNAQILSKETVDIPFSRMKFGIAKILVYQGFITGAEIKGRKSRKTIEVRLKYRDHIPAISGLRRISKPAQRIYASTSSLRTMKRQGGVVIISTSKGLLTDRKAKEQNTGGEVLCEVW